MSITRSIGSPVFALLLLAVSATTYAQIGISVSFAPPDLPVYEQPLLPTEGYIWTPGYWAYAGDDDGYYWVPGTWVMAPEPGLLWTPAYWSWDGNGYVFNNGYWGEQVGFYGGVSYGYGYYGNGYQGGRWENGQFYYNRSINNVSITTTNVYNTTITNTTMKRVSYNGGNGGITARPTPQQESAAQERHIPPVTAQTEHEQAARRNPAQRASLNHGTPTVAATPKPGSFNDRDVVHARQTGAPYNPPVNRAAAQPIPNRPATHPENNAARSDRSLPNRQPESNLPASARPNPPGPNRPEPIRTPAVHTNNPPERDQNRQTQRPLTSSSEERSQSERASPAEPRPQQSQVHPSPNKPEEKSKEEKSKQNEKPR